MSPGRLPTSGAASPREARVRLQRAYDAPDDTPEDAPRDALADALVALGVADEVEVALVLGGDELLRRLNHEYRGADRPTDVLSFRFEPEDLPPDEPPYLGDIVISVPYAARSAARHGHGLEDELRLLAVHGLLHLLGHDDADEDGAAEMRALERRLGVRRDEQGYGAEDAG